MQQGTPKFDGIAVFTAEFSFLGPTVKLSTKAAFVDSRTGHTHGWTTGEGGIWSTGTIDALKALRDSMEADLARLHFTEGAAVPGTGGGGEEPSAGGGGGGLGEHLGSGGEDAPPL